jgi:hypothetical protein
MIASPSLNALARVRDALASLAEGEKLDSLEREFRMVEADIAAALEALEMAADDVERLHAIKRLNRCTQFALDLESTVAEFIRTVPHR